MRQAGSHTKAARDGSSASGLCGEYRSTTVDVDGLGMSHSDQHEIA